MKSILVIVATMALATSVMAKLPPPNDEAKAKAAEAAAKTAQAGKVDAYLLCKAQDKAVAQYRSSGKAAGKQPMAMPACANPGAAPAAAAPAAASGADKKNKTKS